MTERGSYLLLEPGMRVRGADGEDVGTIAEVVADEGMDIFRGIVLHRHGFAEAVFLPGDRLVAVDGNVATFSLWKDDTGRLERVPQTDDESADRGPNVPLLR
jgi:hypothetical protein